MTLRTAFILLLILFSHSSLIGEDGLMIGYSNLKLLPFLDGGVLEFQLGESLWVRSMSEAELILRSPNGLNELYRLREGELKLIKTFKERSEIGNWTLKTRDNRSMRLIVKDPTSAPPTIRYDLHGLNLVAELKGSPNAVFIGLEGLRRYLLVAGRINRLNLNASEMEMANILFLTTIDGDLIVSFYKELVADLILEDKLIYKGILGGADYRVEIEPLVARTVSRMDEESFKVEIPKLHEIGAGGVIPLRVGEAVLRLWINETKSITQPIYVLGETFENFSGMIVDRRISIHLSNAMNRSLRILGMIGEEVRVIELKPPLALLRIRDLDERPLTNITIVAEGKPAKVINDTAYILLRTGEEIPPSSRDPIETSVKVYVNGFEAYSSRMYLGDGEAQDLPLRLHRITIEIQAPSEEILEDLILKVDGKIFEHEDGKCSYLLPPGDYLIEVKAPGYEGSMKISLPEDSRVGIKLRRVMTLDDLLKISAAIELACIVALLYMNLKGERALEKIRKALGIRSRGKAA